MKKPKISAYYSHEEIGMYKNQTINELAEKYITNEDDKVFGDLLTKLSSLIDSQLAKNYSSMKSFWEDMKQDVLLKLWENRRGLYLIKSKNLSQYFYRRIQDGLNRSCAQIKRQYDSFHSNVIPFEDSKHRANIQ